MDTLAMHQAGIDNAVAALGTAMTEAQANLIRKYTDQVIVGFDADAAGQNAALRSLDILTSRGLKLQFCGCQTAKIRMNSSANTVRNVSRSWSTRHCRF
jgi:DNA primase